ncbi:MAG TPA: hypothetical protein PK819_13245 [Thermomicrobiales bacterium]|nr:hypothetical protein [Thermomicrobiales bacterium]
MDVIDPYLNPDNGNTARFLRICQELTGTSRHSVAHPLVQIHTSIGNKPIEQLDKICESWIKRLSRQASLSGSGIAFRVYIYEKDYMHDRFLLTDQDLGIQSGHGFASAESQQGAKLTTWNLLDPEVVHARRIDFNPQLAASRILATLPST